MIPDEYQYTSASEQAAWGSFGGTTFLLLMVLMAYGADRRRRRGRHNVPSDDEDDDDHQQPAGGYLSRLMAFYHDYIEPLAVHFRRQEQQQDPQREAQRGPRVHQPSAPPAATTSYVQDITAWLNTVRHAVSYLKSYF
jgi:hypothetical protein